MNRDDALSPVLVFITREALSNCAENVMEPAPLVKAAPVASSKCTLDMVTGGGGMHRNGNLGRYSIACKNHPKVKTTCQ